MEPDAEPPHAPGDPNATPVLPSDNKFLGLNPET